MKHTFRFKPDIVASLVRLAGLLAILSIIFKTMPAHFLNWLPFDSGRATHVAEFISGLGLLYLASQLHRKKRSAWLATFSLLVVLILLESIHFRHVHLRLEILFSLTLIVLTLQRRQYVVRNDMTSLRRSLAVASLLILTVTGFVVLTFARIDQREYGQTLTTSQTLSITAKAVGGEPLPSQLSSRRGRDLVFSLQAALVVGATLAILGLFYPVRLTRGSSRSSHELAETILQKFGRTSEDYLALWPDDKHYYFYKDSFIPYAVNVGVAVVLHGAYGDPALHSNLRRSFMEECRLNGWQISILHAGEAENEAWKKLGLRDLYIGSEARVDIEEFCSKKLRDKHFRYIKNRAQKDGLSVVELAQPPSDEQWTELRTVSEAWINTGRHEYQFVMGYFDKTYLGKCRIFAVMQNDHIVAYTNLLPTFQPHDMSIDHMRYLPDVSSSTMHFLLMHVLVFLQSSGAKTLNLGLAPLSKIDENASRTYQPVLAAIKTLGGRYYSFAGLEQFKGKFNPQWEPTYLTYSGLPTRLPAIGTAVMTLTTYQHTSFSRRYGRALLVVAALSGLCYASFPLAIGLNPTHAWHTMVSVLGQAGQPYAAVFNVLDYLSSLLAIFVVGCLVFIRRRLPMLLLIALYAIIISNIGDLLAAVFVLPAGIEIDGRLTLRLLENPAVLLHGAASFMNSFGFLTAVVVWAVWIYRDRGPDVRHLLACSIIGLSTIGFIIGELLPVTSAPIQRLFIAGNAIWFLLFCYDILQMRRKPTN